MNRRNTTEMIVRASFLLAACLLLWSSFFISIVIHEVGHGVAGQLAGGLFDGIALEFPGLGGRAWTTQPLVEYASTARFWSTAGGPLASLLLGAVALAVSCVKSRRVSLFATMLFVVNWGGTPCYMLVGSLFFDGRKPADSYDILQRMRLDDGQIRWLSAVLGALGMLLAGWWYLRRMRAACARHIGDTGPWLPFVLGGLTVLLAGGTLALGHWLSWIIGVPLLLSAFLWLYQRSPSADLRRLLSSSAVAIVAGVILFALATWQLAPPLTSAADVVRWVERSPDDPVVLRKAAFVLYRAGENNKAGELRRKALALAPDNPGAQYDWALTLQARAGRLVKDGQAEQGDALREEAYGILKSCCGLVDNPAMASQLAAMAENLGRYAEAADYWERYADIETAESIFPSAKERHRRFVADRVRRLREMAASGKQPSDPQ